MVTSSKETELIKMLAFDKVKFHELFRQTFEIAADASIEQYTDQEKLQMLMYLEQIKASKATK